MESKLKTSQETNFETDHIILGIDEAGRGPVLGPMVYACCYWTKEKEDEILKNFKFADSKIVKEADREKIYDRMCSVKTSLFE
jgi:ribonuclease H2 subunit A